MGSFIAKQPNGLYFRFSTVVDAPTHWNFTAQQYIDTCTESLTTEEERRDILESEVLPFKYVINYFEETNWSKDEFLKFLKEVGYFDNNQSDVFL